MPSTKRAVSAHTHIFRDRSSESDRRSRMNARPRAERTCVGSLARLPSLRLPSQRKRLIKERKSPRNGFFPPPPPPPCLFPATIWLGFLRRAPKQGLSRRLPPHKSRRKRPERKRVSLFPPPPAASACLPLMLGRFSEKCTNKSRSPARDEGPFSSRALARGPCKPGSSWGKHFSSAPLIQVERASELASGGESKRRGRSST